MADQSPSLPAAQVAALDEQPVTSTSRRLALAFQGVFGQEGRNARTSDQRLVLKHMRKVCCADMPVFQTFNGICDPYAAAQRDGARTWPLIVDRQLKLARDEADEQKPKIKVRR